jgi:ATP-binding cassette subfamily C protein
VGAHAGIDFPAPPPSAGPAGGKLAALTRAAGVRMRMVVLRDGWWRHDSGALLGLTEDKQPLALLPEPGGGYRICDPVSGEQRRVDAASAETLLPHAYMFYRSLPAAPLAWTDLVRFVARETRGDLPTIATIALASTLLAMAIPLASGHLFDSVFPAADRGQMVQVVAMLFVASLVTLMLEAARAVATLRIEGKAGSSLQAAVWDRVLKLPVPFFRRYTAGDLATRINGINEIRQALSGTVIASIINSVFSLCNLLLLLHYSARLALLALALLAVAIGVNLALGYASLRVTRVAGELRGRLAGQVFEYLGGIAKLRMTGAESRAFANWAARFTQHKRHALRAGRLANASAVFGAAFPVAASAMLFGGIAAMLAEPETARLSSGDFIAFNAAWTVLLAAALSLVRTGMDVLSIASTYERAQPILLAQPEMDASQADPGELSGAIELSHVSFAYAPGSPPVLDDLSLTIAPGEFIALVGASGSGKSTLLRLLLGFEQPSHGGIYYDGHLLSDINIGSLRRQLGVVLQSGRLAGGDIFSNIAGGSTLTLDQAWAAARACGLEEDIQAMPMGMHTIISDGGGTLSGGQRQRLLVARALVHQPRILFFDEATSALDNRSQAIVSASMEQLKATRVVIAHRLSTIRNADRIYVLERGRIAECGNYDELMARDGVFASLAKRQLV